MKRQRVLQSLIPDEASTPHAGFFEGVGAALLCAVHNEPLKREYKQVSWIPEGTENRVYVQTPFHNFGYTSADAG